MNYIAHRRNTIAELMDTPMKYGVEVDIRSLGNNLIIHHDPFHSGELFEDWINHYQHKTLILNVKEEGLEERLIEIMLSKGIKDYFFLDQSFPFLVRWSKMGENRCAARVSEFESLETALSLSGKIKWVWVDCFTHFPISYKEFGQLKKAGFKICIVSPELQGRDARTEIKDMQRLLLSNNIVVDAVCTKRPELWEELEAHI
jgi:hypothetical protein